MLRGITGTLTKPVILLEGIKIPNPRSTKSKIQNPGFKIQNPRLAKIQHPKSKFQESKTQYSQAVKRQEKGTSKKNPHGRAANSPGETPKKKIICMVPQTQAIP